MSYPNREVFFEYQNASCQTFCGFTLHSAASRINTALSGTAIQSTTYSNLGKAEHAIDGNSDPQWQNNSCSCTASQAKPWWRLDLPGVYRVSEILVTNRNARRNRLKGVEIHIGNSLANNGNDNPRWLICVTCRTITQYWSTPSQNIVGGSIMTSTCF